MFVCIFFADVRVYVPSTANFISWELFLRRLWRCLCMFQLVCLCASVCVRIHALNYLSSILTLWSCYTWYAHASSFALYECVFVCARAKELQVSFFLGHDCSSLQNRDPWVRWLGKKGLHIGGCVLSSAYQFKFVPFFFCKLHCFGGILVLAGEYILDANKSRGAQSGSQSHQCRALLSAWWPIPHVVGALNRLT